MKARLRRLGRSVYYPMTRHPLDKKKNITWDAYGALKSLKPVELENFEQKIVLSNGSTFSIRTTSPRTYIRLNKDTSNSPIWWPHLEAVEDKSGEVTKFESRLQRAQQQVETNGAATLDHPTASNLDPSVPQDSENEAKGSSIESFFDSVDVADSLGMVTEKGTVAPIGTKKTKK